MDLGSLESKQEALELFKESAENNSSFSPVEKIGKLSSFSVRSSLGFLSSS